MSYSARLGICAMASLAVHFSLARGTAHLPPRIEAAPKPAVVEVRLTEPPPPPEPEPPPPEPAEPQKQPVHQPPIQRTRALAANTPRRIDAPRQVVPTERPSTTGETTNTPVFGISMESTSAAGSGPAMPVGNTLQTRPGPRPKDSGEGHKALVAPVQPYEVTKMPLPQGDCSGQYTEEARAAGLEGVVVFDLVVDENGKVRDITVVKGLDLGLTEAARRALRACSFTPGERDGKAVPVRVRSFKIRFRLRENE